MIIDSKKYEKPCQCGKTHKMTTRLCIIDDDCISKMPSVLKEYGINGFSAAIYDENTYNAKNLVRPNSDCEIILCKDNLHADNHGVELALKQIPKNCDYLIAVGSGTIHDITRYCAYELKIPFISCPTAASVDGFCSSVAAMTWNGFKKTFTAVAPELVFADINVISSAPLFLAKSGFGDMMGKYVALTDWKISNALTGEYLCQNIYDITLDATKAVMDTAKGLKSGDKNSYKKLMYGLLMSGLAMQLLGNSRCASGAEHHISHFIEMRPLGLKASSDALHGEKVGVGTLIMCREYHKIKNDKNIKWTDYPKIGKEYIKNMFGKELSESIIAENENDVCIGIKGKEIKNRWSEIQKIIDNMPTDKDLLELCNSLDVKTSLSDIGIDEGNLDIILEYSPLVRNRLTLMRLKRAEELTNKSL